MSRILFRSAAGIAGMGAGAVAGWVFKRLWTLLSGDEDTPTASDRDRTWIVVVFAAALEGAVYGMVKALVDRSMRTGIQKTTGEWPE